MTEPGKQSHVEGEKTAPQHQQLQPSTLTDAPAGDNIDNIDDQPRQVIAVSASKGPAAFFNLARKFLVTDEYCDLSALEGAIVAAVDAAHLLERSKLASIVRVTTSYVTVEPKRKKQQQQQGAPPEQGGEAASNVASLPPASEEQERRSNTTRELRRARIVITVRRTQSYKAWLEENPLQAVIAGDVGD
eukprot:CAMPEP_0119010922 /NCGR_PEP_ID=MMETSP1176-20130426/5343_1 /TAXON_ID=265551 /ORGANISM="Synedropsis recta cf, Strain CCMP1620" /LENGTH=188 /DNA_ID=CAMNT_0006963671 /DNA_START=338 /DNA_END=901 /DNA_ORIENTATION=+